MAPLRTFLSVFAVQLVAWIVADSTETNPAAWKALSTPLVPLMGWLADNWFWPVMIANGLLWSAVMTVQLHRVLLRAGNRAGRA
jgi:hypothetical protein